MPINARNVPRAPSKRKPAPVLDAGSYPARLVRIMTLGVQPQAPFKGEPKPPQWEISFTYELLDEFMIDDETGEILEDKPRWISETVPLYNLDTDRAISTKRYYSLDPTGQYDGDWASLLEIPCVLTLVVDKWKDKQTGEDRARNNISNVSLMRPKEAAKAPELVNPATIFDFDEPNMDVWGKLPGWLQDKIKGAVNFKGSALEEALRSYVPPAKDDKPKLTGQALKGVTNNDGLNGSHYDPEADTKKPAKEKVVLTTDDGETEDDIPW